MKISQNLPQFKNKKTLFIVSGEQEAIFYILENGEISTREQFRILKPQERKQKEGAFLRRGRGMVFGSGAVFEPQKRKKRGEFLKQLEESIRDIFIKEKISEFYVFCPAQTKGYVREILPSDTANKLKRIIKGNYITSHPFELIEKSQKRKRNRIVIPLSEEAKKILDKAKQAGQFWRRK
jgi:hypothetical protein